MSKKEYQNVDLKIVLFLDDLICTSGDWDETERLPFDDALPPVGV